MIAPRRFFSYIGLVALAVPYRILEAIAVRLDGQSWPLLAMPLIWIANGIERCSWRLERIWRGSADDFR